ncbi:hypothetical protein N7471_003746 [Penicillium samsonianum]|uniref:uncharacterized protein n=1 Tax=Penicillium samsonianum TaxID=1882272 RepID=UPI0025480D30|nr:uncharacterized protein N7471_003746 [Penicillium samsonianum]KAJ6137260.1 hypothetical protein N7471_003746 [Penicillium samsonianum]
MAWLPSNSFLENHPSLSEAGQSLADLNYIAETFGYPPSTVLPEPSALFTDNCFNGPLMHCPQPDRRAHVGLVGVGSHQSNYNNPNNSSIKSNRAKVWGAENVTGSSAIWPQSLPSLSSTNGMGQMSNHSQVLEYKSPGSTNPIGESE